MMKRVVLCLLVVALVASATTLSGSLAADNAFYAYLSTSPTSLGTLVAGNGSDPCCSAFYWENVYPITPQTLAPGTTYYLQVDVNNWGGPGGLLGSFDLSDSSFEFQNGTQSLITDTTNWTYSYTGFDAAPLMTPNASQGQNGVGPWGFHPGISSGAYWIWDPNTTYDATDLFFETTITPLGGTIPEPASMGLLGGGLVALGLMARRKHSA